MPPPDVRYCAGALILDAADVTHVVARSAEPLLRPEPPDERSGIVPEVVFPTAIEPANESEPGAYDVYYGMADTRIGVARLRRADSRT
jgi:beta-1,2-mannobiose phosphorylase / 1,2-beta-oligomannan phosphorylase